MASRQWAPKFMRGNIMVFSITDLLGNFSRAMVFPYVSLYILALGGNAAQIGIVNSLAPLAGLIMFPLGGYIADHTNRVKLIVLAGYLSVVTILVYIFAPSWQVIAIASLIQGFFVFQMPAKSSLIADSLAPEDRGKGIAYMNTISSVLAIFAPFVAGTVIAIYGASTGVRAMYGVMMAVNFAGAIIHLRFLQEPTPRPPRRFKTADLPNVLKDAYTSIPGLLRRFPKPLIALAGVIILSFMANGVASSFWVVYAVDELGLSSATWGLILLIETAVRLLMFIPAGLLVDRWGRTKSLLGALTMSLVAIPLFVFTTDFTGVLLIRLAVATAFATAIPACTALMADLVPRDIRGRVMSAIGQGGIMLGAAGGGTGGPAMGYLIIIPLMIASLLGGYLYQANPAYPWFFVAITTAVSILLVALFIRDPRAAEV